MNFFFPILGGFLIGLIVAVPIGPVNLICVRRTFAYGPASGYASGVGAALGDATFAVITAFGLTAVSQLIEGYSVVLRLAGGLMLLGFAVHTFRADTTLLRDAEKRDGGPATLARSFASTFALTITNPATLLGFAALFAGFGGIIDTTPTFFQVPLTVLGVVAGSASWWFMLVTLTGVFHKHIDSNLMHLINRISGVFVGLFGAAVIGHLIFGNLG